MTTIVTELEGGITRGVDTFALFVIAIDKYVLVLFRKTQYEPTAEVAVVVGRVKAMNPELEM